MAGAAAPAGVRGFVDYASNGLGYAVGVMHGVAGNDNYSPYFDNAVRDMYDSMRHQT